MSHDLKTVSSLSNENLARPKFVFRPQTLNRAIDCFTQNFNSRILYAVKTNPDEKILNVIYAKGITSFDVASLEEVELVYNLLPDSTLYFMHPVKSRHAINEAYHKYGVRNFSLDSEAELKKILQETGNATDLNLHVRLSIPNNFSKLGLEEKFGINLQEAPSLLKKVASCAKKKGICFHVGSQCMHPDAYRIAIRMAAEIIEQSGVNIDYFNVGGGFPSIYPDMTPPEMVEYFDAIHEEFKSIKNHESIQLLAEPGRALVAETISVIVKVILRKDNYIYINEGTYGSLFDAGAPGFIFPTKLICDKKIYSTNLQPFSFYGPTCDSLDYMKGPFYLPNDIDEGDLIEIGQIGAYGKTLATGFNGFKYDEDMLYISDQPLMTMYDTPDSAHEQLETIAA